MINRPSAYRGKLNRKGHRKSRLGCGNCKRRRVKCDEVKPACGPCTSHLIACNFEVEPSSHENLSPLTSSVNHNSTLGRDFTYISSSQNGFQPPKRKHTRQRKLQSLQSPVFEVPAQRSMLALGDRPFEFSMLDVELFHNYMSSTSLTLGDDETSRQLLQIQLPRLGFSFHYVVRLLLAFSGFHLARMPGTGLRQNQTPTQPYLERAQLHYTIALSQLIPSVTRLNTTTFRALYAASSFMCFCTLARAPQPGDYLLFSTSGRVELPTLLHGVRSILETREQVPVEVDASSGSSPSTENVTASSEPASHSSMIFEDSIPMTARFSMPLDHIRHLIFNESEQSGIGSETYWKVYGDLVSTFQLVRSESRTKGDKFSIIFGWLYRLPNAFIVDLQERRPISLILFAFFAVLLKDLSCYWFIDGWPEHIMIGIQQNLDKKYESWILWLIAAIE